MTARAVRRRVWRFLVQACLLLLLFLSGFLWYTTTESFQRTVRGRLISAIEHATGGRAELGSFHVVPLRFEVEIRDLTIHGREASGEIPYVHVDSVLATVNISSVLGAKVGFHTVTLQHPVVHVMFYADGSTNKPTPKKEGGVDFQQLFAISIGRLEVQRGELLWQDLTLPLDFTSNEISASLNYSFLHRRYSGQLAIGKAETQFDGYRPVAWAGRADFAIDQNGVDVRSLKASSQSSRVQASGVVANFRNPTFKGKYDLLLDLTQTGAVAHRTELKAGTIEISGDGSWSPQSFASTGKFDLHNFSWQDKTFFTRNASALGEFFVDPQKISLSQVEGRIFHGNFRSEAELVGWQTVNAKPGISKEEPRGIIKVRAKDVSLAEMLASLGPQFRPVNQLKLAGAVSGTSEVRWKGSIRDAETSLAIEVGRPSRPQPGQIPVSASAHGTYRAKLGELEIRDLAASTPATQMRVSGALSSSSGLKLNFASNDLGEWQPVTAALFPSGMPFSVHGRAVFNGTATGRLSSPTLTGNLQVQDFDILLPATAHASAGRYRWDSLTTDLQGSSRSLAVRNAVLKRGDESLKFDGSVGLFEWRLVPESAFRLRVDVHNGDSSELARLAGYKYEVRGILNAGFDLSGTAAKPQGQGSFTLSRASIRGQNIDSASASLAINGAQATFKDLRITRGSSHITGDGMYDLASQHFQLRLAGTDFDLAELSPLERSRIKIAGKLDFSAQASGTTEQPDVTANLRLRNLTLNEEMLGDFLLDAVSHGPNLHVSGHSEFKSADLVVDGNVQLRDQWPAHIDLRFNHLDVDSFLVSYLHGHVTGHSAAAGSLVLEGPLRNLDQLSVVGNLTDIYAEVEKVKLRNDGPIRFAISQRALKIDSFHILGENVDFSGSGSMQLAGNRDLDFEGRGKADLQLLHLYDPDFSASGILTSEAKVTGTLDAPLVKGKLQIQNGSISDINLPSALSELNGTFLFSQNQVTIESLTARTGGGTMAFTGHAELVGKQVNFDLTASANAVRLRYPPGVSSTANAELHWSGSSSGSLLSGDITVIKLGVTPGFDFAAYLQRSAQVSSLPQTDPVLNRIRLDLHVVTAPELQMQTSIVRLQGDADLRLRGNAAKPVLLGRADVLEGEAYFNGTKYRLERGGVTFNNPAVTTPFLDLEATTHVRDYEITLSLSGEIDKPKVNYRSEPPLASADIIALLAFGQTTEQSAQFQSSNQSAFSQQASNAMLAAALNATLSNRTQRLFGVSRIKIDPQGLATETSPTQSGPAVTIEQQVKDNLTITYTTNVAQTSQQVIQMEYNVSKNVSIVAIRDQNGVVSFDVKIRRRKR